MKYDSLKAVYLEVMECEKCELCRTRRNVVFGEGDLNAKLMFIGEGPGEVEDETGRPFVGPAGQLLDKMIEAIGLKREQVYICNIVKCRPPHNATPIQPWVDACIGYVREQVRFIHPKIIVCLGKTAITHVLHESMGVTRIHGTVYDRKGFKIIPTFHPSALLRNEDYKRPAWEDFKKIKSLLEDEENL